MGRRTIPAVNAVPPVTTPYPNSYINCSIAQSQSGNIDQSRQYYEDRLTSKILNAKTLTAAEKVKFLKILETL